MGMFDTVMVDCPYCGEKTGLQSKAGRCELLEYDLTDAPLDVMGELVSGGGWKQCDNCEGMIVVKANGRPIFTIHKREIKQPWED